MHCRTAVQIAQQADESSPYVCVFVFLLESLLADIFILNLDISSGGTQYLSQPSHHGALQELLYAKQCRCRAANKFYMFYYHQMFDLPFKARHDYMTTRCRTCHNSWTMLNMLRELRTGELLSLSFFKCLDCREFYEFLVLESLHIISLLVYA